MGGLLPPSFKAGELLGEFLDDELHHLSGTPPKRLYHYTTFESVINIINSGTLRARALNFMNDASEVRFAASIFRACLDKKWANAKGMPLDLHSALRVLMSDPIKIENVYSFSMTATYKNENMWKRYGEHEKGFCLVISTDRIQRQFHGFGPVRLYKCLYGERPIITMSDHLLNKAEQIFDLVKNDYKDLLPRLGMDYSEEEFSASYFAEEYLQAIAGFAPAFKPSVWKDEQEWRCVSIQSFANENPKFIDVDLWSKNENFLIAGMVAGRSCNPERIGNVQKLLEQHKILNCPIKMLGPGF